MKLLCLYDQVFRIVTGSKTSTDYLNPQIQAAEKIYDRNNQRRQTVTCVCHTNWFKRLK